MSEHFPQAGSLGIVLMIGIGFFAAGGSNVIMGGIADHYLPDALDETQTVDVLEQVEHRFPEYAVTAESVADDPAALAALGYRAVDVRNALDQTKVALAYYRNTDKFHGNYTGNALRAILETDLDQEQALIESAFAILRPTDNYGGKISFLWIAPFAFLIALVFLVMFIQDKKRGGYQAVKLNKESVG